GIQRPEYLVRDECPARIRAHSPEARVLAVLRDPVARAVSAWFWYVQFGRVPFISVDAGIEALLDGTLGAAYPHGPEVLEYGFYGRHLSRYLDQFGPERVLVLLIDELEEPATFARIYGFLGVDPEHRPAPAGRALTNAGVYDRRRLRVLRVRRRWVWSWDGVTTYTYRPRRWRRPLAFLPNAAVVAFDRVVLASLFGNERPRLRPDLETRLRALYTPDVAVLESLLGRDLSAWKTPTQRSGPEVPSE
ncbi:MAG: sulfotransferase domain-containing protein, partial [Actinomycetota bacterium]|nr:sulfotransferase domain-containing protein [Actinomycetota bacterium]